MKRVLTLILCLLPIVAVLRVASVERLEKPNSICILADDLSFNQVGAYGDTPIKTPNLDRLASDGIRFTQASAGNTVCSPSQVSLFTGRDGRLMEHNSNTVQLREIDVTIAHVRKRAGDDPALFGKHVTLSPRVFDFQSDRERYRLRT